MALIVAISAGLTGLAGCSGRSTFLSGGPTVGQLKTSVSHLEYENAQLKRDVAKLQQENRSFEDRLVQEEIDNGDLTAQLNDARNLLSDRGIDKEQLVRSRRDDSRSALDDGTGARTLPAGRPTPKRRKLPVARIPGQIQAAPPSQDDDTSPGPHIIPDVDAEADRSSLLLDDNLDHHTYYNGPLRWAPIASGPRDISSQVR
jgi:hypothetical protein